MTESTDSIPSVGADRASLNVGGRTKNKKPLVIGIFALLALAIIGFAGVLSFMKAVNIDATTGVEVETNHSAGTIESTIENPNNYFEAIKKQKEQAKKAEEQRRKREEAEAREQAERERKERERLLMLGTQQNQRTGNVSGQPRPSVNFNNQEPAPLTPYEESIQRKKSSSVTIDLGGARLQTLQPQPEFDDSFNGSRFAPGRATLGPIGAADFLLSHGTAIPCAIYTQIISDYEGFVTCRTTQDVYSKNGATLLVERGSLVSGTQKVSLELGKARIFTIWSDIDTTKDVKIRLNSLGTGPLGASGIPAWVDNHFSERFGSAILLSFIDDAFSALAESQNDNNVQLDNSTENASDIASKALDASINIKPTGYSQLGQRINIMVVRDVDMSSVYQLGGHYK